MFEVGIHDLVGEARRGRTEVRIDAVVPVARFSRRGEGRSNVRKFERRPLDVALIWTIFVTGPDHAEAAIRQRCDVTELFVHQRGIGYLKQAVVGDVIDEDVRRVDDRGSSLERDEILGDVRIRRPAARLQRHRWPAAHWAPQDLRARSRPLRVVRDQRSIRARVTLSARRVRDGAHAPRCSRPHRLPDVAVGYRSQTMLPCDHAPVWRDGRIPIRRRIVRDSVGDGGIEVVDHELAMSLQTEVDVRHGVAANRGAKSIRARTGVDLRWCSSGSRGVEDEDSRSVSEDVRTRSCSR